VSRTRTRDGSQRSLLTLLLVYFFINIAPAWTLPASLVPYAKSRTFHRSLNQAQTPERAVRNEKGATARREHRKSAGKL